MVLKYTWYTLLQHYADVGWEITNNDDREEQGIQYLQQSVMTGGGTCVISLLLGSF